MRIRLAAGALMLGVAMSAGNIEARHTQIFADFTDRAANATFVGPSIRRHSENGSTTLSVLPQIHGGGNGTDDQLQLDEFERVEVRLVTEFEF